MADLEASLNTLIDRLQAAVSRLESVENRLSVPCRSSSSVDLGSSSVDASVSAFDAIIESDVARLLSAAEKIGGEVLRGSQILKEAFSAERHIILTISKCKQPDTESLQKVVQPLASVISKAVALTEGRRTEAYNHLKAVAESLTALTWVAFTGKDCGMSFPATHVEESWQAAEFYNNKVLVEYRNKDDNHVEWARALKQLYLPAVRDYAKKYHLTGPAWNAKGIDVEQLSAGSFVSASSEPKGPPLPPPRASPPPPPVALSVAGDVAGGSKSSMNAVFQQINKGEGIASGLRKVTDDMKSKNRTDRIGTVPAGTSSKGSTDGAFPGKISSAKFELQMDRKWVVENQVGNKGLVISKCNAWQSVYIFGCKDSVLQIKGKVNNITVDKCSKTGIVFKDVVAACEIVNCTSIEVQCQGMAPSITIDNTIGCQLYLSRSSLDTSITTAKSSEINVLVPGDGDADLVEHSLPEQFVNIYKDGAFVTTPVSHSGG